MKLPVPDKKTSHMMIGRAKSRYDACVKVYGKNSEHTRFAKKTLDKYTQNAINRGYIKG